MSFDNPSSYLLYRGLCLSAKLYHTGHEVVWPGFSSCTTNLAVAKSFCQSQDHVGDKTMFFVESTAAVRIAELSHYPEEEVWHCRRPSVNFGSPSTLAWPLGCSAFGGGGGRHASKRRYSHATPQPKHRTISNRLLCMAHRAHSIAPKRPDVGPAAQHWAER